VDLSACTTEKEGIQSRLGARGATVGTGAYERGLRPGFLCTAPLHPTGHLAHQGTLQGFHGQGGRPLHYYREKVGGQGETVNLNLCPGACSLALSALIQFASLGLGQTCLL
jgi:hypothetical protein